MVEPPEPGPATRADADDPAGLDLARSLSAGIVARAKARQPGVRGGSQTSPGATGNGERGSWQSDSRTRRFRGERLSSGAHPDERDPQLIGRSVDRLVEANGWAREVNIHSVLGRWSVLVGPALAQHTEPEALVESVLTVRASSTAWATQLRGLAPALLARLNEQLGDGSITRIQVLGPDVPSWKRGRRSVPGRGPRDTYG